MTLQLRRIDDAIAVAPQIDPADMQAVRDAGYVAVINNRPDDEEQGQPAGEAIRAAAEAAGLRYTAVPVTGAGFSWPQVEAMAAAIAGAGGPVLAYCRSGTRSCNLWALAAAKTGGDPAAIAAAARNAGYDLTGLRPLLDQVAGQAQG